MNLDLNYLFMGVAIGFTLGYSVRALWDFFMERR